MSEYYTTKDCTKSLLQMAKSCRREASMRRRVYPKWVEDGKMTAEQAQHEIECMEAAALVLGRLQDLQAASEEMRRLSQKKENQLEL